MVTNLQENTRKKCERYWPEMGSEQHGPFRLTLRDKQVYANYVVRELQMEVSVSQCAVSAYSYSAPHVTICSVS